MKKIIAMLLIACLSLGVCACGNTGNTNTPTEATKIELTKENISQYLNIKLLDPVKKDSTEPYYTTTIEFYPLEAGAFSNVSIVLLIEDNRGNIDTVSGADGWSESKPETIPLLLPVDGRYAVDVTIFDGWRYLGNITRWSIKKVSGTFTAS